jgi:hypothetical protein
VATVDDFTEPRFSDGAVFWKEYQSMCIVFVINKCEIQT